MNQYKLDEMFFEADRLINEGNIAQAVEILNSIIQEQPDYGKAYNHLGWVYERRYRDYAKAETFYRTALAYSPEYTPVYYNYAALLSIMNKFTDLERLLEKAMSVPGINRASIYNEYGIMHEIQRNFDLAIKNFKNAIAESLSEKDIEMYQESIRRCEKKRNLLS